MVSVGAPIPNVKANSLESFNPMEEAFVDPKNAYPHLQREQQPYYKAGKERNLNNNNLNTSQTGSDLFETQQPFSLHVMEIPRELEKEGLRNLFSRFGHVNDVYIRKIGVHFYCLDEYLYLTIFLSDPVPSVHSQSGHLWGRVSFLSHMSAQSAIDGLHLVPPFNLRVRFSITEAEKEKKQMEQREMEKMSASTDKSWQELDKTKGIGYKLKRGHGANLAVSLRIEGPEFLFGFLNQDCHIFFHLRPWRRAGHCPACKPNWIAMAGLSMKSPASALPAKTPGAMPPPTRRPFQHLPV